MVPFFICKSAISLRCKPSGFHLILNGGNWGDTVKSVLQYIQRQVEANGHALAFSDDERTVSYAQLLARSAALRDCFLASGIQPGNRVGMALSDDIEMMAAIIGTWACHATAVPIDFRNRKSQRKVTLETFELAFILEDDAGTASDYRSVSIDDVAEVGEWQNVFDLGNAPAFIAQTSGTSGLPSGIVLSHETYCHRLQVYHICYPLTATSKTMLCYPISFAASRTLCVMTLMAGGQNCIAPYLASGEELVEFIRTQEITEAYIVPVTLQALVEAGTASDFKSLRYLGFGSAPTADSLKARAMDFFKCDLVEVYSATSTGGLSFHTSESLRNRPETVGKIFDGIEVEIVDGNGNPLPPDHVGLVRTRGPALIGEVIGGHAGGDFLSDSWAYPGDLGSIGADRYLTLSGRRSEMIVRGGEKIYPLEVEMVLLSHPNVSDAAVVAIPHSSLGEQVAALVCSAKPQTLTTLRSHCVNHLPGSKVPAIFKIVEKIPRNANGKILCLDAAKLFLATSNEAELS